MKKVILFITIFLGLTLTAAAIKYPAKLSKWNAKRHVCNVTNNIVLHTTEGSDNASFHTVHRYGTCNYIVLTNGTVLTIIEDNRVAKHAGRSMWFNRMNLSNTSVGIEVVGYHDHKPTAKQFAALKTLIAYLRNKYHLSQDKVVTHSMVAYDTPNQWYSKSHRGRKRCGMLFATKEVRMALGLDNVFTIDPDVAAHRLIDADSYLASVLYRKVVSPEKIAKDKNNFVQGKAVKSDDDFEGFRVITSKGVWSIAGEEYNHATTIYFFKDGLIFTGAQLKDAELKALPLGTKVLVGYIYGGKVTKERTAYHITDGDADLPSTYYRFPDKTIKSGDKIDGNAIPPGTIVLFRS